MALIGLAAAFWPLGAMAQDAGLAQLIQSSPPAAAPAPATKPAPAAAPKSMPPANLKVEPIVDTKPLRLTPNKNELLRLDEDAASVIVNNPNHATVMLDSARLLIIAPRMPGTTSFTVLNNTGQVIMQKDIIVSATQPKYVRVRRICGNTDGCVPAAYYYCPDGCYEVTTVAPDGGGTVPPAAASASNAANSAANMGGGGGTPQGATGVDPASAGSTPPEGGTE